MMPRVATAALVAAVALGCLSPGGAGRGARSARGGAFGASRARGPVARRAAKGAATAVDDVRAFRRLLDEEQVELSSLDVRGDTEVLRGGSKIHPVLAALRERAASRSRPGHRTDGMRIGLAIEGGGMRGAVGAGMVAALFELGYADAFDGVYGSSAGALVGAYFVSRQLPRFGPSIYYECLGDSGRNFIDPVKLVRSVGLGALLLRQWLKDRRGLGEPVLDLDYLLIDVMEHERPLDWAAFTEHDVHTPLRVLASALESQRAVALGSREGCFGSVSELGRCLRASMLLPGITGPPVRIPGSPLDEPLADAVLTEPVPFRAAVAEGCTHVLVLRTKPDGARVSKKLSIGEAMIARRYFGRKFKFPKMLEHMLNSQHKRTYAEDILLLNEGARGSRVTVPIPSHEHMSGKREAAAFLMPVALPAGSEEMGRLEVRSMPILQAIQRGFVATYDVLAPETVGTPKGGASVVTSVFPDALVEPAI